MPKTNQNSEFTGLSMLLIQQQEEQNIFFSVNSTNTPTPTGGDLTPIFTQGAAIILAINLLLATQMKLVIELVKALSKKKK